MEFHEDKTPKSILEWQSTDSYKIVQLQSTAVVGGLKSMKVEFLGRREGQGYANSWVFVSRTGEPVHPQYPRFHRFVWRDVYALVYEGRWMLHDSSNTQLFLSTDGCHPCQDCVIPLGYLEICPHSTAVNVWTTDMGCTALESITCWINILKLLMSMAQTYMERV